MSVVLKSTGGGQVTLQEPTTASDYIQTLPASTGTVMVSGNMPAFRVYPSTTQTISHNTLTKVNFGSEIFDTNNNFASSTFTPTVAGYYQQNYNLALNVADGRQYYFLGYIYVNGNALYNYEWSNAGNPGGRETINFSELLYLNGTGDYVEVYLYSYDYTAASSIGIRPNSSWSSSLARAA
jgi:hypothetical protein